METKDYINIDPRTGGGLDFERKFKKLLTEKQIEIQKEKRPYCTACAWEDFKDKVEAAKKKILRNISANITGKEKEFDVPLDLDKYAEPSLFKEVGVRTTMNKVIVQGTPVQIPMLYVDFKCERGHGYSIEYSEEEYARSKGTKSKK